MHPVLPLGDLTALEHVFLNPGMVFPPRCVYLDGGGSLPQSSRCNLAGRLGREQPRVAGEAAAQPRPRRVGGRVCAAEGGQL